MSKINLGPGIWTFIWGPWHIAWLIGFFWAVQFGGHLYFTILYTVFLPAEIIGAWRNGRAPKGDTLARTLSEWRQWVAAESKDNRPGFLDDITSWRGLAGFSGVLDALITALVVGVNAQQWLGPLVGDYAQGFGIAVGIVWGLAIGWWLVPHFGWRGYNG